MNDKKIKPRLDSEISTKEKYNTGNTGGASAGEISCFRNCSVPSQLRAKTHLKSTSVMGVWQKTCQNTSRDTTC